MTQERWLPVVGYEGLYEVSDHGRVRSFVKLAQGGGRNAVPGAHVLKGSPGRMGYPVVTLGVGESKRRHYVHALVLCAFVGPRPPRHECLHGDGVRTNNCVSNLRWGTRQENVDDMVRHGNRPKGSSHPMAVLTEDDIRAIRTLRAGGLSQHKIGERLGVHRSTIASVDQGRSWMHVV